MSFDLKKKVTRHHKNSVFLIQPISTLLKLRGSSAILGQTTVTREYLHQKDMRKLRQKPVWCLPKSPWPKSEMYEYCEILWIFTYPLTGLEYHVDMMILYLQISLCDDTDSCAHNNHTIKCYLTVCARSPCCEGLDVNAGLSIRPAYFWGMKS